jgi:hypothetical protein
VESVPVADLPGRLAALISEQTAALTPAPGYTAPSVVAVGND